MIYPAIVPLEFASTSDLVAYMQNTFNAVPVVRNSATVGFELKVKVIGQPFVVNNNNFERATDAFASMVAGTSGYIKVDDTDVCMHPRICGPLTYTDPDEIPVYWVEGRLDIWDNATLADPAVSIYHHLGYFLLDTIEHDPLRPAPTPAWCWPPGGSPYPCMIDAPIDNQIEHSFTLTVDGEIDQVSVTEYDQPAINTTILIWEDVTTAGAPPAHAVTATGGHYSTNFIYTDFATTSYP